MNNHQIAKSLGVSGHKVRNQREKVESGEEDALKSDLESHETCAEVGECPSEPVSKDTDEAFKPADDTATTKTTAPHEKSWEMKAKNLPTPCENIELSFRDRKRELEYMLHDLLDNYENDGETEDVLFSKEGIEASLKGLQEMREIIEKYEHIVEECVPQ